MNSHQVGSLSVEASKLFRIRKTVLKMLKKRDYIIDQEMLSMDAEQFKDKFGDK
jgi:DNA-directed RNA polymerase I, II, and III subunit RPABC1